MACKPNEDFEIIDNQAALDNAIALLKKESLLAVKCEGENATGVNREKDIIIMLIATKEKTYVFDVLTMGKAVFTSGLQSILESKSQEKLIFDCREQSDALWHQFQIKISGVLDLQLLEVMYRRENSASIKKPAALQHTPRSHRPEEVECVYGFYHCIELYAKDKIFLELNLKNEEEKNKFIRVHSVIRWERRPLQGFMIQEILVKKIMGMFILYEKMKEILSAEEKDRLLIASERYGDFYRTREKRSFNQYEANTYNEFNIVQFFLVSSSSSYDGFTDAYLPLDIIPEKGTHSSAKATHTCTTCARKFPRQEFSNTQLRNGDQKCRVCKEIKRRADVESNREENYEKRWFRWQSRRHYDDFDDNFDDSDDEYY